MLTSPHNIHFHPSRCLHGRVCNTLPFCRSLIAVDRLPILTLWGETARPERPQRSRRNLALHAQLDSHA